MEEFEDLESELRNLYQEYITRQRCISYLEHQQEQVAQAELMHIQEQQVTSLQLINNVELCVIIFCCDLKGNGKENN